MDIGKIVKSRIFQLIATGIGAFLAGLLVSILIGTPAQGYVTGTTLPLSLTADAEKGFASMSDIQAVFRDIAQKVSPAVVEIDVVDVVTQPDTVFDSPFQFFFGPEDNRSLPRDRQFRQEGLGSGVIVRQNDDRVYVLTNFHVIDTAEEISVTLSDKSEHKASVVGKDERKDLALIVFESAEKLPVATLGNSDSVAVGDWVIAVGNPLGFASSVTQGIVSAVGRNAQASSTISPYNDYFQTDAAINQGNSGGALININGEVIGINTWIASPSGGSVGLGFAIPINNAKKAIEDFITRGSVAYGWLGITTGDLREADKAGLRLGNHKGSFVHGVYKNSPAAAAGLLPGDYITAVDGKKIDDMTALLLAVGNLPSGAAARIDVIRQGAALTLTAAIREKPLDSDISPAGLWPGISPVTITDDIRNQLRLSGSSGNIVVGSVESGSAADAAGIRAGDIILSLNAKQAASLADFYAFLNDRSQNQVLLTLSRNNREITVGLVK